MFLSRIKSLKEAWREALLILAIAILVLQFMPKYGQEVWHAVQPILSLFDLRNYSWAAWGWFNVLIVFVLVALKHGPEMLNAWKSRQLRRKKKIIETDKEREVREQREMLERLEEGRSRRIY